MPATSLSSRPRAAHPLRILYADDFPELRNYMRTLLTKEGHLIETVPDGATALDWLRRAGPAVDLLITDHYMPRMTGLDLVRQTRQLHFPGKILVFSSELREAVHDQYRRLGVDSILPKPVFPATLRRVLDELFTPAGLRPPGSAPGSRFGDLVLA